MEDKITTIEEYEQCLNQKKELRNDLFNLKIEIFMNKNDLEKVKLLEKKQKIIKSKYAKLALKIEMFELEKTQLEKKEGKIK